MEIFNFLHLLCKFKRKTFNIMETTNYFKNTIKFSIVAFSIFLIASCYNGKTGENARQKYYATDAVEEADDGYAEMVKESEPMPKDFEKEDFNTESYDKINENAFVSTLTNPLSTFSVDVDRAAYANVRRFLEGNQLPPPDAVRIEEMVNYFNYNYPLPTGEHPFSVNLELANCPWNSEHQLISIGLKGKEIEINNVPSSNLVFLIDVSGSMSDPNKLPLLKQSFKILIEKTSFV
jgi:hypothetical protein